MRTVWQDILYGARVLFSRPALTFLSIIALSISIGIVTTTFSNINAIFFKPLPFAAPGELSAIFLRGPDPASMRGVSFEALEPVRESGLFVDVMAWYEGTVNVSGAGRPSRYTGAYVTTNFLGLLGHEPLLGEMFSADGVSHDGRPQLMISYTAWEYLFRKDPHVLGRSLRANGVEHVVQAVLPQGFGFPTRSDIWIPLTKEVMAVTRESQTGAAGAAAMPPVMLMGRRAGDMGHDVINQRLGELTTAFASDFHGAENTMALMAQPAGAMILNEFTRYYMVVLIIVVALILLISCANVANLLVGRAVARSREMAIRAALGATRWRLLRQLLTESFLISGFGAVGGLLYAAWALDFAQQHEFFQLPYFIDMSIDANVIAFVVVLAILTGIICGILPAWQSSRADFIEMLKDSSQTHSGFRLGRMSRLLTTTQVAFACALIFGAGLVLRNVHHMSQIDPLVPADKILTMRMGLFPGDYPTVADRIAFFEQLVAEVRQLPGVAAAGITDWLAAGMNFTQPVLVRDGEPGQAILSAYHESVCNDYFATMQMRLLSGRLFGLQDWLMGEPVVVVNEVFARNAFGSTDVVGHRIGIANDTDGRDPMFQSARIVGVVSAVRLYSYLVPSMEESIIYLPYPQRPASFMTLTLLTHGSDMELISEAVQQKILELDPHLPVYFVKTVREYIEEQIYPFRFIGEFFLAISLMALFLAGIGVYGMIAFNVNRRRREIGIRMALGATGKDIARFILREGVLQVGFGLIIGTLLAIFLGQLAKEFLLGVNPWDPSVYAGVLLILIAVTTTAFYIPARRATTMSPMEALRHEN